MTNIILPSLPASITAALASWPRDSAGSAVEVLEAALAPFPALSDPAWTMSKLGRRGFPVELSFKGDSGDGSDLRYTVEVDRPDRPPADRLRRAFEVAATVGRPDWPDEVVEMVRRLHADHADALAYGAWLGVRHAEGAGPGLKLYAELPPAAAGWVASIQERWGFGTWGGARPVLLGVEAGRLELYFQTSAPRVHELRTILERAGFEADAAPRLRAHLERAYGLSLDRGLPAPRVGLSYGLAEAPADGVSSFTLYQPADTVFGGDLAIRRRWIDLHGHADSRYTAVAAPLDAVGGHGGDLHHGLFGVVLPRHGGDPVSALGLTPPVVH